MKTLRTLFCFLILFGAIACASESNEASGETSSEAATAQIPPTSAVADDSSFTSPLDEPESSATIAETSSPLPTPINEIASPEATYEVVLEEFSTLAGEVTLNGKTIHYIATPHYGSLALTGLTSDGREHWIVNNATNSIFSVDSISGEISQSYAIPQDLGQNANLFGLAWDGENFWVSEINAKTIAQYDSTFQTQLKSFTVNTPPGDIAWDGEAVWVVSRETSELQKWSTDGQLLESQQVPGGWITGLTWGANRLWYADTVAKAVSVWNPVTSSGKVIIVDALADTSFGGLGWKDNSLLLLDDVGGRLLSFDIDEFEFLK